MYSQSFKHHIGVARVAVLGIQIIAFLMIAGCSSISPEAQLNNRATDVYTHVTNGDWQRVHGYFLPEFQKFCSIARYTEKNVKGMQVLKHMLGIPEKDSLEFSVIETSVYGLKYSINKSILMPPSFGIRNSAKGNHFSIQSNGPVWVFLNYAE